LFFHKFFQLKRKGERINRKRRGDGTHDLNNESSEKSDESDEEQIWQAMKKSIPKTGSLGSISDDDSVPEDLDVSESDTGLDSVQGPGDGEDDETEGTASVDSLDEAVADDDTGSEAPESEWGGLPGMKRKRDQSPGPNQTVAKKKRKKAALPTFASYDDYARMIEGTENEESL